MLHIPYTITDIKPENATTKTFTFDGSINAEPGQFVMGWLPRLDEKPFSLAGVNPLKLMIAAVGPFSEAVHRLQVGDKLWIRGPLGKGYQLPAKSGGRVILVGGGYGSAPLHFLARQVMAAGFAVDVIIGARTAADLLLADEFEALGARVWLTTEDSSAGITGRVTDALPKVMAAGAGKPSALYACGPTGMLKALAAWCGKESIPAQLSWEAHMRCGIGLCGSCEAGDGWLTCQDGPVFHFDPEKMATP